MKIFIKKGLSLLLISMMAITFSFTVQAKKNKDPYLGPTVEECKTNKRGDEKCKIKKLHGQKAIEFIYQALLESNAAIAENAENIAALGLDTGDLREQINMLSIEISDNDGKIATNASDISDLFSQLSDFQTTTEEQAQDILTLRADLMLLESASAEQAIAVQGQIGELQRQITDNNDATMALLETLREMVESQEEVLLTVKGRITELDKKISTQVGLLHDAIALVQSNLDDQELFTVEQFQYATDQRTLILADIVGLQTARDELERRANELRGQLYANETKIGEMESQVLQNSEMITEMQDDIVQIRLDLAQKQDILEGNCPEGMALSSINPDGSIACTATANGITRTTVSNYTFLSAGMHYGDYQRRCTNWFLGICTNWITYRPVFYHHQTGTVNAYCPSGSTMISGYSSSYGLDNVSEHMGLNYYEVTATNKSQNSRYLYAYGTCLVLTYH